MLLATCRFVIGEPALRKQQAARHRAPAIEVTKNSDYTLELRWTKGKTAMILERRFSPEALFEPLREFSIDERSYVDTTVPSHSLVEYRLRPADARYLSEFGPIATINLSPPVPPPPQLSRAGVDSVVVRMSVGMANDGAVIVERRIGGLFTPVGKLRPEQTSFGDGELPTGFFHYYRLRYENDGSASPPSAYDSVLLDLDPPHDFAAQLVNDHTVRLTWRAVMTYPAIYEIEKRAPEGIRFFCTEFGDSTWTDTDLAYEQMTYYRLRIRTDRDSSEFTPPVSAYYSLSGVDSLRADPVHDRIVHLTWRCPSAFPESLFVECSRDSVHFETIARLSGRAGSFADSLAARGQRLFYRVACVSSHGKLKHSDPVVEVVPFLDAGMVEVVGIPGREGFLLDAVEVTVQKYIEFCYETRHELPGDPGFVEYPDYWLHPSLLPAVNVSWLDAVDFCNWRSIRVGLDPAYSANGELDTGANGYRLPIRQEVTAAITQITDAPANLFESGATRNCVNAPEAPASHPQEIQHLIGNVWEWSDESVADSAKLILGGAYTTPRNLAQTLPEFCYRPDFTSPTIGFRCVLPKQAAGLVP